MTHATDFSKFIEKYEVSGIELLRVLKSDRSQHITSSYCKNSDGAASLFSQQVPDTKLGRAFETSNA